MPRALRSTFGRLFSFSAMLASLLATFLYFFLAGRNIFGDPDLWWHLRDAQYLLHTHAQIHADMYSFTASRWPWINSEWLSELPFYLAWERFGPRGLFVLTIGLIEAVTMGVCTLCWQRTRNVKPALLASCVFMMMISVSMGPRTVMFGWLCLIVELLLLAEFRAGRDRLWLLPALFAVWVNLHGTWPIGIVYLALFVGCGLKAGEWGAIVADAWTPGQRSKLLQVSGLSLAALFVNPYGWRLVAFPFQMVFAHKLMIESVEEWQSLSFHAFRGKLTFAVIAGLAVVSLIRRRTWRLNELVFLLIALLSALTYTRLLVLAGIALCPLLASELDLFEPYNGKDDKPILNFAVMAVLAAIVVSQLPKRAGLEKQIAESCPVGAVRYLQTAKLQGRVMNELTWGGYLEWSMPQTRWFIDSRSEIYDPAGVLQDYIDAATIQGKGSGPLGVLDEYRVDYVLFPAKDPIVYLLARTPGWGVLYQDGQAALLGRLEAR